ncbi:unnamed protein product [Chondrus crispus]|uniref:Uncharacterized protein n=1 Tax=Chondrus crispus TaxID=2769 RepID=R7QIU4_CHOCR|nr:unnamed protein product [Chondrus crispus]CDF37345.1 unnamed protein product [Chondrus crispus]|eukprot:XP_005717164.1 unnamed protein product [Chondrus crispus]
MRNPQFLDDSCKYVQVDDEKGAKTKRFWFQLHGREIERAHLVAWYITVSMGPHNRNNFIAAQHSARELAAIANVQMYSIPSVLLCVRTVHLICIRQLTQTTYQDGG